MQSRCELLRKQSLSATFVTVAAPGGIHLLKASCYFAGRLCSCEASAAPRSRSGGAPAKAITAAGAVRGPTVPRRTQAMCGDVLPKMVGIGIDTSMGTVWHSSYGASVPAQRARGLGRGKAGGSPI